MKVSGSVNGPHNGGFMQIPKSLEFLDEEDEKRKCLDFKEQLLKFQREMGVENFKVPSIGGKELDLCKLYKAVVERGGSQRVSNNKLWKEIVNLFEIPASCTSASFTLRNHYNRCLLQYEKKFFFGQTDLDLPMPEVGQDKNASISAPNQYLMESKAQANVSQYQTNFQVPPMTNNSNVQYQLIPSITQQGLQSQINSNYLIGQSATSIRPATTQMPFMQNNQGNEASQLPAPQQPLTAASVNLRSKLSVPYTVKLSSTKAESKRLVLAFESRIPSEINWALNTLAIFSCNTNQNLTLENQPYLLESMSNYMVYCVQQIESINFSDPLSKKNKHISVSVPSYIDAFQANESNIVADYKRKDTQLQSDFGMLTKEFNNVRKRDAKLSDKSIIAQQQEAEQVQKKQRGRKTKVKIMEEQNLLDQLRKKRKKLITVLHQQTTEFELIEHLRMIVLIIRNLSFIRANEHHLIKCFKLLDIMISLFVDLIDREITHNCLDFMTNIGKHIMLSEVNAGRELIDSLYTLFSIAESQQIIEQVVECLRRLSLGNGNEEFLEELKDQDIQNLIDLLLSTNIETREGCLEILCTISDRKTQLKVRIAQQQRCIERLIGLIAIGSQTPNEEKISKLAALILANLNLAPSNRALIAPYEQELALIAATDEKTCKIIADILGDLDSYQVYSK